MLLLILLLLNMSATTMEQMRARLLFMLKETNLNLDLKSQLYIN